MTLAFHTAALEASVAQVIRDTQLLGCGCCVPDEEYEWDGCPRDEDGLTEHTFAGDCIHALRVGRETYITRAILLHLEDEVARLVRAAQADAWRLGFLHNHPRAYWLDALNPYGASL